MAEEEKKKGINKIFPFKNLFKRISREIFGVPFHYTETPGFKMGETPTYKLLDQMLPFKTIESLNRLMVDTEKQWDGNPGGEHIDNIGEFRKNLLKLYTYSKWGEAEDEDKGEITDSIGPFTDEKSLRKEGSYAENGTGTIKEPITIRKNDKKITGEFSIPRLRPIIYEDGRGGKDEYGNDNVVAYQVAFFGHEAETYWQNLENEIQKLCNDFKNEILKDEKDKKIIDNISKNIDFYKDVAILRRDKIREFVRRFEYTHRSNLTGQSGVVQHYNVLRTLKGNAMKLKLTDEQVHYTHTFKVIKPVIRDDEGKIIKRLQGFKLPEEVDEGLDEHGWPLEVGDGITKFEGRILKDGEILLDIYKNRSHVRVVPEEFIVECDPLLTFTWMYVYYDAYRDDLRDARYHQDAITVIERIITELGIKGYPQTMDDIKKGKHAIVEIKLNQDPSGVNKYRPANESKSIKSTIKPTNLLPAFDLRGEKFKTKHRGRMYYYETQNESEQSTEPTITTRGAAMYILHRVIEEVKYWGGTDEPSKAGVVEILREIGGQTGGFDIGANMGEGERGWGKNLSKDPFNPFRG